MGIADRTHTLLLLLLRSVPLLFAVWVVSFAAAESVAVVVLGVRLVRGCGHCVVGVALAGDYFCGRHGCSWVPVAATRYTGVRLGV